MRRSKLTDLDERMVERYLRYRGGKQSIQPGDRAALKRWLSVLRDAMVFGNREILQKKQGGDRGRTRS
jgi:hypothetical protein